MKNKIIVIFSTHLSNEENVKFEKHIAETIGVKHRTVWYTNLNQFSLTQLYNKALNEEYERDAIFVFCHNDIVFKTQNWGKKLLSRFNNSDYGILGVAGTTFIPESGRWWDDRSKMYGTVEHTNGISQWISEYSEPIRNIQSVVHVDGLFMSVDPDKIEKKFNENYGKFHFYDLTFCVDNYLHEVYIGVIDDIKILHKSVGATNDEWEKNRIKFIEEYKEYLPIKDISSNNLRVLICCQFFKNYTGSEVSNFELAKELKKLGCDVTIISTLVGDPLLSKAKKCGIKVFPIGNAPNFMITEQNQLAFYKNQKEFDIIHINHKPIGTQILQMYPNTPAVMHVRSEVIPTFEEPIINPQIKKYISIRDSITEYIKSFNIEEEMIVEIDNPFDYTRFNTDYKPFKSDTGKEVVLFVGTLDYLRKQILFDLYEMTKENNQLLWIIGENSGGYVNKLLDIPINESHVRYFGVKSNVEDYVKKCNYTAGIFKGRTTIEGYLCGKPGWIYKVDKEGNILEKELNQVPKDIEKYRNDFSAKKVFNLYEDIIEETWFE